MSLLDPASTKFVQHLALVANTVPSVISDSELCPPHGCETTRPNFKQLGRVTLCATTKLLFEAKVSNISVDESMRAP